MKIYVGFVICVVAVFIVMLHYPQTQFCMCYIDVYIDVDVHIKVCLE